MSSPSIYSGNSPHAERALCARARCNWLQCVPQAYRQSFKGQDPRQARPLRPPRENRRGGNLAVFEHPQASYPRSFRCAGPARLGPRSELVAAAGIGGGGLRLRYRGWLPLRLFFFRVASIGGES